MARRYRVIQWETANTGAKALRFVLQDPSFELAGLYVAREGNAGRDAGEPAGLGPVGVAATSDPEAIIAPGVCSFLDLPLIVPSGSSNLAGPCYVSSTEEG